MSEGNFTPEDVATFSPLRQAVESGKLGGPNDGQQPKPSRWEWLKNVRAKLPHRQAKLAESPAEPINPKQQQLKEQVAQGQIGGEADAPAETAPIFSSQESENLATFKQKVEQSGIGGVKDAASQPLGTEPSSVFSPEEAARLKVERIRFQKNPEPTTTESVTQSLDPNLTGEQTKKENLPLEKREELEQKARPYEKVKLYERRKGGEFANQPRDYFYKGTVIEMVYRRLQERFPQDITFKEDEKEKPSPFSRVSVYIDPEFSFANETRRQMVRQTAYIEDIYVDIGRGIGMGRSRGTVAEEQGLIPAGTHDRAVARAYELEIKRTEYERDQLQADSGDYYNRDSLMGSYDQRIAALHQKRDHIVAEPLSDEEVMGFVDKAIAEEWNRPDDYWIPKGRVDYLKK